MRVNERHFVGAKYLGNSGMGLGGGTCDLHCLLNCGGKWEGKWGSAEY